MDLKLVLDVLSVARGMLAALESALQTGDPASAARAREEVAALAAALARNDAAADLAAGQKPE